MRHFLIVLLLIAPVLAPVQAADPGGRAEYLGGTLERFTAGDGGRLHTQNPSAVIFATAKASIGVPYDRINLLEYGQNVNRRVFLAAAISPLFLLTKARKHFLTIGYQDERGAQQAMVLRLEKSQVRVLLASLEARTGLKVEFQDEEARRAGKG